MSELRRELVRRARAALELHRQASGRGAWLRDFAKEFDRAEEARVARSLARSMLSTRGGAQAEDKLTREVFEQLRKIPRDLVQFSRTTLDPEERRDKLLRRARLRAGQYERVSAMRRRRFALIDRGVRSYRWRSRRDGRVRDLHRELDSQIFDLRQGHPTQGHPGDSPGCRCSMVPIRRGLFKAAPAGARRAPPSGWEHIPGGKKGGFRKRKGNKWVYWYPEYKPSSRRGPPKKGEVEPRWGRKKQAPSDPKDIKIAQDEETARGHVKASVEILDRLPAGSSIITDDGETFTKDKDGWGRKNKGDRVHAHEMVEHIL